MGQLYYTEVKDGLNAENSYYESYDYDAVRNQSYYEKGNDTEYEATDYIYNSLNQLTSSETINQEKDYTEEKIYLYYADGSLKQTIESVENIGESYKYDVAGRLSSYEKAQGGKVSVSQTNEYNGSGVRIQKIEGSETTNYYYGSGSVLYTEDGSGNGTALNLTGISGNAIATARDESGTESYYYYNRDVSGSTTNVRNAFGASVVLYQYSDYGETTVVGDTDFYNEICYNGSIYDESTGLYYLNARYYSPTDAHFVSRDSYRGNIKEPLSLNLYAYCWNNPISLSDPSGHGPISWFVGGCIAVGMIIGGVYNWNKAEEKNITGIEKVGYSAIGAIGGGIIGGIAGQSLTACGAIAVTGLEGTTSLVTTTTLMIPTVSPLVQKVINTGVQALKEVKQAYRNYRVLKFLDNVVSESNKIFEEMKEGVKKNY